MDFPIYCVVRGQLVRVVESDGAVEVWMFDSARDEFVRRKELLDKVMVGDEGVVELTEGEFDDLLQKLRALASLRAG